MPTVGFVGLGNIGSPMAASLLRAGLEVLVVDRRAEAVDDLVVAGARAAGSVSQLVHDAEIVGICVTNDAQVRELFADPQGVLAGLADKATGATTIVIHSTILPRTVRELGERAEELGARVVDAQVSGGDLRAAKGELAVMVGGTQADVSTVRPYLEALGSHIRHMGPLGAGAATKLAMQHMVFTNQLAALEAVRFAAHHDVSEENLMDLVSGTAGESFITRNWGIFDRQVYVHTLAGTPLFYQFFDKDLFAFVTAARDEGLGVPLAALSGQLLAGSFGERRRELDERGLTVADFEAIDADSVAHDR